MLTELTHEFGGTVRGRAVTAARLEMVFRFRLTEPVLLALPFRYGWHAIERDGRSLEARESVVSAKEWVTWTHTIDFHAAARSAPA